MSEAVMLRIAGKPFRCDCGCNVFHSYRIGWRRRVRYECNACGQVYAGE